MVNVCLKKFLKTSLLLLVMLIVTTISVGCESVERLDNDVNHYKEYILPTYPFMLVDNFGPTSIQSSLDKNTLVSIENSDAKDEYICGYVKKDLYDFIKVMKEDRPNFYELLSDFNYFSYDAIMGEYISYIYYHFNEEIKSIEGKNVEHKAKDKPVINSYISNDSIRWYKYFDLNDIKEMVDEDYYIDIILFSHDYTIKKDVLVDEEININGNFLYPKMYKFIDDKLKEVVPDSKDYIWNQLMVDLKGEYIKLFPKKEFVEEDGEYGRVVSYSRNIQKGPFKLEYFDGRKYIDTKNINENIMFFEYSLYSYTLEKEIDNKYYYDYDRFINLINDILDNKLVSYYARTKRWPNEDYFEKYGLDYFSRPTNVIVQISKDNEIILDNCYEAQYNILTKSFYDQGFNLNSDGHYVSDFDSLFINHSPYIKFNAFKNFNDQTVEIEVLSYNIEKIIITFKI